MRLKTLITTAALLGLVGTGLASNGAIQYRDLPVLGGFYNECTGEAILVSGTAHVVFRGDDLDFNDHHLNMKGAVGVSDSGRVYNQKGATTQNTRVTEEGDVSYTFQVKLVSDDGHSLELFESYHLNVDADGNVIMEHDNLRIECE